MVARARRLPPTLLDERVNDEFSFIQTLRHLVFASDRWLTGPVFGDPEPTSTRSVKRTTALTRAPNKDLIPTLIRPSWKCSTCAATNKGVLVVR